MIYYYPFGLKHKGYNSNVSSRGNSVAQKFKYNGIELEEGLDLNLYEMDIRSYDPAIGSKWLGKGTFLLGLLGELHPAVNTALGMFSGAQMGNQVGNEIRALNVRKTYTIDLD